MHVSGVDEHELAAARALFRAEADDAIAGLTRDLLALEHPSDGAEERRARERVSAVLHTLKGSSGMVGLAEASALFHAMESEFLARVGAAQGRARLVTALLDALDTAHGWIARSQSGRPVAPEELERARAALTGAGPTRAAAEGEEEAAPERAFVHASTAMLDGLLGQAEDLVMSAARVRARAASLCGVRDRLEAHLRARRSGPDRAAGAGLDRVHRALEALARELGDDSERLDAQASGVLERLRELRMLPFSELCGSFHRPVREMARELGKEVRLEVRAGDVWLDKQVLEGLKAPLVHLLRNAVAHGVELPAARALAGKPVCGTVRLEAERRGHRVAIRIADDGAGLDVAAVREAAVRRGLLERDAPPLTPEAAAELVFQPGFSTRTDASAAAGRGVGLSVVREAVARLHGDVRLGSRAGAGSEFTLTIPLTIAASRGLLVRAGGDLFALSVLSVERVARVPLQEVRTVQGVATLELDGEPVRLASLAGLLGRPGAPRDETGAAAVVLVRAGRRRLALRVDAILGELAMVVKDLPGPLAAIELLDGATVLDDGRVVPLLSTDGLARAAADAPEAPAGAGRERKRLLVVDDSATSRQLIARELEQAGYRVATAADGAQALALLETEEVHAVLSDVHMPHLDGLELARTVRATPGLANLTFLLVTSADAESDRVRGADAGADAYVVKRDFDRERVVTLLEQAMRRRGVA